MSVWHEMQIKLRKKEILNLLRTRRTLMIPFPLDTAIKWVRKRLREEQSDRIEL